MKWILRILGVLLILIVVVFISGVMFIVDETKQVVITQFGRPVGQPITDAGLYFKTPFIQKTHYFEKRLLEWDGDPNQIPTKDKRYIWIDVTARWKISDALTFLQSVGNELGAHSKLDNIVNSATRDVITSQLLVEAIRNTNRIMDTKDAGEVVFAIEAGVEKIEVGRQNLTGMILDKAKVLAPQYGIELVDVRIKRINYVKAVGKKVYERMIAERKRAAEKYRSEGQGKRAEIEGQTDKELKQISSEAYRKSQVLRGKADAEITKIYADAYNKDPQYYSFLKTLETYRTTIDEHSTMILTTDSDYYRYLKGLNSVSKD